MKKHTAVRRAKESEPVKVIPIDQLVDRINRMLDSLQKRAFEIFMARGEILGQALDDWLKAESVLLRPARVEVRELEKELKVIAEASSFKPSELEISVEPRRVVITGNEERKEEEERGKTLYSEISSTQTGRVVDLPAEIDPDQATFALKNGVLELTLPKAAKAKKVWIDPNVA